MEPPNKKRKGGGSNQRLRAEAELEDNLVFAQTGERELPPSILERRRFEKILFAELPDLGLLDEYSPRTAMDRTMAIRAEEEAAQAAAKWNEDNEGGTGPLRRRLQKPTGICERVLGRPCGRPARDFYVRQMRKAAADAANKEKEMQTKMAAGGQSGGGELTDLRSCDSDSDDNVASSSGTVADR